MMGLSMSEQNNKKGSVASRLRFARTQAGLSQAQVAEKFGLYRPAISEIEAGRRKVSAEELSTFAELYDVDVRWLAGTDTESEAYGDKVSFVARRLSHLKDGDLDNLLELLHMLRADQDEN
jgi:transcriptional regulator with XRE-family HTH domain